MNLQVRHVAVALATLGLAGSIAAGTAGLGAAERSAHDTATISYLTTLRDAKTLPARPTQPLAAADDLRAAAEASGLNLTTASSKAATTTLHLAGTPAAAAAFIHRLSSSPDFLITTATVTPTDTTISLTGSPK